MDGFWITPAGDYYQGDQVSHLDLAVPPRPDAGHIWQGGAWVVPAPTPAEQQRQASQAVQSWLDTTAQGYQFNDIISAVSYADDPTVPLWQTQGQAFRTWRGQVWKALFDLQAQVQAGTVQAPATPEALIALLPQPNIPAS